MEVFISWSGPQSEAVAVALRGWLPLVINALKPWLSSADMDKGTRWRTEVAAHLEQSKAGVICLTPSNTQAEWLLFEAGALSKTVANTFVCVLLVGLGPSDITGPLAQFQATKAEQADLLKMVKTLNRALDKEALDESQVQEAFDALWPKLAAELKKLPADQPRAKPHRADRELLEELLNLVRNQNRPSGGTFTDEDFKAALTARVTKAITRSGLVGGIAINPYPDRLVYKLSRRDGSGVFDVVVPNNTPFESVEEVVRTQMPLLQTPLPPGVPQPK
jgi:TIR domain-containing protein